MAKSIYSVSVIREGREKDYIDFWTRGKKINSSGERLHPGLVGFTETVEANNMKEAVSLVQTKHPGLKIDVEATNRLGRA